MAEPRTFRNIVLCGFMGAGKSTVARHVAEGHGFRFFDTDDVVERSVGRSVADIFSRDGEAVFRRLERDVLAAAARLDGAVIATGGGAVMDPVSRSLLASTGLLVYLEVDLETLVRRIGASGERPLAVRRGPEGLAGLFEARRPVYEALDVRMTTEGRTPEALADAVVETFLHRGGLLPLPVRRGSIRDLRR